MNEQPLKSYVLKGIAEANYLAHMPKRNWYKVSEYPARKSF